MFIRQQPELSRFLFLVSRFVLPFIVLFLPLEYLAYRSGELWSLERVIYFQTSYHEPILFNRKVIDDEIPKYKYLRILGKKPEVIAVGSSRSMQFRENMFKRGSNFYNAAGTVHNIGDALDLIKNLPSDVNPKVLLINLDFYWFGDKREVGSGITDALRAPNPVFRWQSHLYADREMLKKIFESTDGLGLVLGGRDYFSGVRAIGLQALEGNGFRVDGSYQYGKYLSQLRTENKYVDRGNFSSRLEKGESPFYTDSQYDKLKVGVLEDFLEECNTRGIKVFAFAPPMSTELYRALNNSKHHQRLFNNFRKNIPLVFKEHGVDFFDFSDIRSLELTDLSMFDGLHPTEIVMAKILLKMSDNTELGSLVRGDLDRMLLDAGTKPFEFDPKSFI